MSTIFRPIVLRRAAPDLAAVLSLRSTIHRRLRFHTSKNISYESTGLSPSKISESVQGFSGRSYRIESVLQDKGMPLGRVYLATTDEDQKVVVKEIPQDWKARNEIYRRTSRCSHIRLPIDSIPESRMLIFEYIEEDLLSLIQQREVPMKQIKRALKWTLEGISQLHAVNITHNDIKPNNILLQTATTPAGLVVERVLLTDLEDAVRLEPGRYLQGATLGNLMWRSPEAHAGGPMEAASDLFAFGIVVIPTILFRQMSYFADDESGVEGLLEYLGDNDEMRDVWEAIVDSCRDVRKNPIMGWQGPGMDDDFKDLVKGLTKLDPRRRISANEALRHRWFAGVS
ncbi:uncharacterized protein MYCGRDRAFT_75862 [Zymoseptoria tritici IPO323]|uniref:Protein kinase domain-containing protein n=1 Tax=Zymoseptoria tritici (strain CBS 115943 / IPO323) TaxID=336722 RepID=F9XK39_ZYMTI|nr:uncharacterized protein MYCGRDRAFT_75862 [Zymoseptoria tritici IPO323]EGP84582.1 hypothetical protein MYCGRDRAFT_75862 [Zymoseptoria tritici IPO323]